VLVSSLLNPYGVPARILNLILLGELTLCCDLRILEEYREVLLRPRFKFEPSKIESLITQLEDSALIVIPSPISNSLRDPDDQPFLEVAIAAQASYLITGNIKHFPAEKCRPVLVTTPSDFLSLFT
jgi:putative PIN family toxin of toxin-antitoxin system